MEFGRLSDLSAVDFRLPGPDPRSRALSGRESPGMLQVFVGLPKWTADSLHTPGLPAHKRLSSYADRYNSIELNATFHAIPEARLVATWAASVPPGFRFCPKVPRTISHPPTDWEGAARQFADVLPHFGTTLGPCFFQAPPEVGPDDLDAVFLRMAALRTPMVLELRHPAFFRQGRLIDPLFSRLVEAGVGVVVTDTPGRRDVVHRSFTTTTLMLRFLGDAEEPTSRSRLASWAQALRGETGLREVYVFVHQPDNLLLLELAGLAREAFGELCVKTEGPRQRGLFG